MTREKPSGADERLAELERDGLGQIREADDEPAIERVRVSLLGKKGRLTALLRGLGAVAPEDRAAEGKALHALKSKFENALSAKLEELGRVRREAELSGPRLDYTLPSYGQPIGHVHPLSQAMREVCEVLSSLGFSVAEGPEVEDEYHNFEALNIPGDHPARDMQDTFFTECGGLLRTHTSPVQIRTMELEQPPLRIIAPGAVYRQDDDVTHSPMFHQVEGLLVDKNISFGHLKGVLTTFLRRVFDSDLRVRFRPSYFPFTEPSAEIDIGCVICGRQPADSPRQCRVCKGTGWLEILGAGMVHPAVFECVGYDPEIYSGFAFGLGVERVAMLKYGIDDIRLFYGQDLRFLQQF